VFAGPTLSLNAAKSSALDPFSQLCFRRSAVDRGVLAQIGSWKLARDFLSQHRTFLE